jgi:hypothetical protein
LLTLTGLSCGHGRAEMRRGAQIGAVPIEASERCRPAYSTCRRSPRRASPAPRKLRL